MRGLIKSRLLPPTPAAACIRLLAATAYELVFDLCHVDAEQAVVQSNLEEDVFLRLPQGCGNMSGQVLRLNRSLYGLKTSIALVAQSFAYPHENIWA